MNTRRAALDGLTRLMDATALEELFAGNDDDALFMLELLREAARGREATCYWEICRTARRRGVTPEYVADRAAVLLGSIEERRRSDVYRILGVRPLADSDAIRRRWLEIAKREHPDVGGDPEHFRRAKDAYELLKDSRRRGEYERYWLRALGPFDRVAVADETPAVEAAPREHVAPASTIVESIADIRAAVARVDAAELDRLRRDVARRIDVLEGVQADLAAIRRVRRVVIGAEPDGR